MKGFFSYADGGGGNLALYLRKYGNCLRTREDYCLPPQIWHSNTDESHCRPEEG